MAAVTQSSPSRDRPVNIVFFGQTGAGKSSTINLIAGSSVAGTANDARARTRVSACYKTTIRNEAFNLWDTLGVGGESKGFFRSLLRESSEPQLRKFLGERYQKREIDLLVYCIRGSASVENEVLVKNYHTFCLTTRRLAAPVVIVVTNLERENNMEDWWERNGSRLKSLGMEFDGHACITALSDHRRTNISRMTLHDLISRNYSWKAECDGSYFGSPVQQGQRAPRSTVTGSKGGAYNSPRPGPAPPHTNTTRSAGQSSRGTLTYDSPAVAPPSGKRQFFGLLRGVLQRRSQSRAVERSHSARDSLVSQPRTPTPSSYHTAYDRTPQDSRPTTPVDGPDPHVQVNHPALSISTDRDIVPLQPSCEESDSTTFHSYSMFSASSGTSCSSRSDPHPQPLVEDHGGRYRDLTAVVKRRKEYPIRSGGFGDIWECDLMTGENPRIVAVKAVRAQRTDTQDPAAQEKKLRRELNVWAKLQHENVVELLGVVFGFGVLLSMVSPWFSNGSLSGYISNHLAMDLSVKQALLLDIASGLRYLHTQDVVHGDLHSNNVLVDENGRACLADFGLSVIIQDIPGTSYLKMSACDALRYADPELVRQVHGDGRVVYPTKPSDVYSFGGLTLYILSGRQPYEGVREILVTITVLRGDRPPLPVDDERLSPEQESLIQRCWSPEESTRPLAEDIITLLQI